MGRPELARPVATPFGDHLIDRNDGVEVQRLDKPLSFMDFADASIKFGNGYGRHEGFASERTQEICSLFASAEPVNDDVGIDQHPHF